MSQYLFLLTITPVQSFIETARKTQDLYAGSYILSHLCRLGMEKAKDNYNAELLFPDINQKSLPNRFLAILKIENEQDLEKIGFDLENTIYKELTNMPLQITTCLNLPVHKDLLKQVKNYFHIFWAFWPLENKDYHETYKNIEMFLASTKNVRRFSQLSEVGQKCSVSGEHNVLYYKKAENSNKTITTAEAVSKDLPDKYLAPGEALGGIAFVKRCADKFFGNEYNSSFPSTARIALMDAYSKLVVEDKKYLEVLEKEFEDPDIFNLKNKLKSDCDPLAKEVFDGLEKYKINYSPYYAIVLFDGDNMGTWLSGKGHKLKKRFQESLKEFHLHLSENLGCFAKVSEEKILIPPRGVTVYAGGDDFLGFVNLNYLFEVLKNLREQFSEMVDISEFAEARLTFSAGVAVAHYKTPLKYVLSWARRMEKEAKNIDSKKDAFGLALIKHSGEITKNVYKWQYDGKWTTDLVSKLIDYINSDFSPSFIRTLHFEFAPLLSDEGDFDPENITDLMVKSEIKRLIGRAYLSNSDIPKGQQKEDKDKKINGLLDCLWSLYINSSSFDNFLSVLDFAAFIEREVKNNAQA